MNKNGEIEELQETCYMFLILLLLNINTMKIELKHSVLGLKHIRLNQINYVQVDLSTLDLCYLTPR